MGRNNDDIKNKNKQHHGTGNTAAKKNDNAARAKAGAPATKRKDPPAPDDVDTPGPECSVLTPEVLKLLGSTTGLADAEAWQNIWLLVSKGEQDNEDPKKAFLDDKGGSLFTYAAALSYDASQRGVTIGAVGWTTANDGKDGDGDAPELFKAYAKLGGEDLTPLCKGCTSSKSAREKLIAKIHGLADDPRWVLAQWQQLLSPGTPDGAYLYNTVHAWKKVGIQNPSALAIATVFDASLNQGNFGKDGGCLNLEKLAVKGDENATLEKYNAWRRKVAGTNQYNEPSSNGQNRADQFEKLRHAGVFSLKGPEAAKAIKSALSWTMK